MNTGTRIISSAISAAVLAMYSVPAAETAGFFSGDTAAAVGYSLAAQNLVNTSLELDKTVLGNAVFAPQEKAVKLSSGGEALPSSFDLRNGGGVASIKNQGLYSTCWTFSSASDAETGIIGAVPDADLSEMHSALFANYIPDGRRIDSLTLGNILDMGGNTGKVLNQWAQWHGPVAEEKMPYDFSKVLDMSGNELETLMNSADYHLKNAYIFDYSEDRSNFDEINGQIKELVYSGHSVSASIYYDRTYYNGFKNALYANRNPSRANHSISIIGWDDSYPADNFNLPPAGDGAWLVKNSWGTSSGENGCFWISYYDTVLSEMTAFEMTDNDDHDYNLYYDHAASVRAFSANDGSSAEPSYMANVYRAENDMDITALATYFINQDTDYEVTVYTGLTDPADPSSGTPSKVTKGNILPTGYFTIDLDEPVPVAKDEYFSVAVKLSCEGSPYVLAAEETLAGYDSENGGEYGVIDDISYENVVRYTESGQSFFSADGKSWTDTTELTYVFTDEEKQEYLEEIREILFDDIRKDETKLTEAAEAAFKMYSERFGGSDIKDIFGNNALKVFGDDAGKVRFSHISGEVGEGEEITLTSDSGEEILCSVNGGKYEPYRGAIAVSGDTVISATTDRLNFYEKSYKPAKAQFNDILYKNNDSSYYDAIPAERVSESSYRIELPVECSTITLCIFTGADIAENSYDLKKGAFSESIHCGYGETKLQFDLSEPGKLDNCVELTIFRKSVTIDLYSETISYPYGVTVYAPDGSEIADGDEIGQYAGQTLKGENPEGEFTVDIPERAQLPELEIDYDNEILGFIPNDIAELTEYSTSGGFFMLARERLIDGSWISSGMALDKAFRVIPGETVTLRTRAGNGMFAGDKVTYTIPEAPAAPEKIPSLSWDPETGLYSVTVPLKYEIRIIADVDAGIAEELKGEYTDRQLDEIIMKRTGADEAETAYRWLGAELCSSDSLEAGREYLVRYAAANSEFASEYVLFTLNEKGDANANGSIEASDATMVLRHYTLISSGDEGVLDDEMIPAVDMDGNGLITAVDASYILKLYADKQLN